MQVKHFWQEYFVGDTVYFILSQEVYIVRLVPTIGGVKLDYLLLVVIAAFPHCKFIFPFAISKYSVK